ncbi:MAG TPA: phage holin family protein [Jatrophihabitans sp.]|nr:phage holin family protein [Jatrophihabitans sp.]
MTANENGTASSVDQPSIGTLVADVSSNLSTVLHGEIELAKLEIKSSVKSGGFGVVFFILALVMVIYAVTFGLIALAEGFVAMGIWRWAAFLIVFGIIVVLAGICALIGVRMVKKVRAPKQTIDTTKDTVAALKQAVPYNAGR